MPDRAQGDGTLPRHTAPLLLPSQAERICALCDLPIEPHNWDDRHDIGLEVAHAECCISAGCEP